MKNLTARLKESDIWFNFKAIIIIPSFPVYRQLLDYYITLYCNSNII